MITRMKWSAVRGLAICSLTVASAFASPILVSNFSFETLPGTGLPNACGGTCKYSVGSIPSWTATGTDFGQFQPDSTKYTSLSNGPTDAYSNGGTISQVVGATVQAGAVYTLLVDIGFRLDAPFAGTAALLIGTTPVAATGTLPTRGTFGTFTATYTGTAADAGKPITIQLLASGQQGDFDNVRLDATLTPEPESYLLLGSALLALTFFARRRLNGKTAV